MSGMLHLKSMESISLYGLSDIRLYFDWESDYEFDRIQLVQSGLDDRGGGIPAS